MEATRSYIQNRVYDRLASSSFTKVIIHKQTVSFNDASKPNQGHYEIGYWCDKDHQKLGYETGAVDALVHHTLKYLAATQISLRI